MNELKIEYLPITALKPYEKEKAEKEKAEKWQLSEREIQIVKSLGR